MANNVVEVVIRAKDEASAQLKEILNEVGPLGAGLATITTLALGTAGALASLAAQGGERAEDLRRLGQQSGLTARTLSELDFAARLNETSVEALATGIKFLNRNMYDAKTNGGEVAQSFKAVGISTDELKKGLGSSDEALQRVATGLSNVTDPGTRAALTIKLLGRSGIELLPLLLEGGRGIEEFRARADELGITVSDAAAVIGDQFGDAVKTAQLQVEGLKAKVAEQLLPSMTELVGVISDVLTGLNSLAAANPEATRALFATSVEVGILAAALATIVVGAPVAAAALTALGVDVAAIAAAGGPIALAIAAVAALVYQINLLHEQANKPFLLNLKVATNIEGARAELNRLAEMRDNLQKDLDNTLSGIEAHKSTEGTLNPQGRAALFGAVNAATLVAGPGAGEAIDKLFNDTDIHKAAALRGELDQTNKSIDLARALIKQLGGDGGTALDTVASGASAAEEALAKFLKMLEDAKKGIGELSESDIKKALALPTEVKKQPDLTAPLEITNTKDLEGPARAFTDTTKAARELFDVVDQGGGNVENLIDAFVNMGSTGIGVLEGLAGGVELFRGQLDPIAQEAIGVAQAIGDFVNNVVDGFVDVFKHLQDHSRTVFQFLGALIGSVGKAVLKLIADIAIAIAKAIVLRIVTSFLGLAGGGTLPGGKFGNGAYAPGLQGGGTVVVHGAATGGTVRMNAGKAMMAQHAPDVFLRAFSGGGTVPILRAASGIYRVPGPPQRKDNVLIAAHGGESVLPLVGGREPGNMLADLARVGDNLQHLIDAGGVGGGNAPVIGTLNINALDSDSIRNQTRPGGELDRQTDRAWDLGRGRR